MDLDQDYGQNTFAFLENAGLNTALSKTYLISSATALEGSFKTWPRSGMTRLTRSLIHNSVEFHNGGVEFTFWESVTESPPVPISSNVESVLDQRLDDHRQVLKRSAQGYLRRQSESGKPLPTLLNNALTNLMNAELPAQ